MSKKRRTFKAKTIALSEASPVAGAISPEKDTLFIKQVESNYAKLYASDSKGKTLGIVGDIDINILTKKQIVALKNKLEGEDIYYMYFGRNGFDGDFTFYHNGERKVYNRKNKPFFLEEGGKIVVKSEDFDGYHWISFGGANKLIGKNMPDVEGEFDDVQKGINISIGKIESDAIVEGKHLVVKVEGETQLSVNFISPLGYEYNRVFYDYGYGDYSEQDIYIADNKVKLTISGAYGNKRVVFKTASGEELARQEPVMGAQYQSFEIEIPYYEQYKIVFEDVVVIMPRPENNELPTLTSSDGREDLPEIIPDREKDVPVPVEESAT